MAYYFNKHSLIDSSFFYTNQALKNNNSNSDSLRFRLSSLCYNLLAINSKKRGLLEESKKWHIKGIEAAQKLYRGGDAARGIPTCAGCHGPDGAGLPAQFPRLSGQFAEYTATQLKNFRAGDRTNDPNSMMRDIAYRLNEDEIKALSEYIATLH